MTTAVQPNTIYWKRHDTAPTIVCELTDSNKLAIDLTGATVKFIMTAAGSSTPKIAAAASIVTTFAGASVPPTSGLVSYTPVSGDTDTAGTYNAEWEVTFSGGAKETFPDPSYLTVVITADLDNA